MNEHHSLKNETLETKAYEHEKHSLNVEKAERWRRLSGTTKFAVFLLRSERVALKKKKDGHTRRKTLHVEQFENVYLFTLKSTKPLGFSFLQLLSVSL